MKVDKVSILKYHKLANKHFDEWQNHSLGVAIGLHEIRVRLGNQFELWLQQQLPEITPDDVDVYFRMLETKLGKFVLSKMKDKLP